MLRDDHHTYSSRDGIGMTAGTAVLAALCSKPPRHLHPTNRRNEPFVRADRPHTKPSQTEEGISQW